MAKGHALLSASGAARWLACPPSARLEEQFPASSSEYAEEGTLAHGLAEITTEYFLNWITEDEYENLRDGLLRTPEGTKYYTPEMQEHAADYAALVKARLSVVRETCPDAFCELEVKVDFSRWVPDGFGTADCVIIADGTMEIIDFKYGKGYKVEAEGNAQMRLYALGALVAYEDLYDIKKVRMMIFQPRINNAPSDEITTRKLVRWASEYVKPRAQLAMKGEGKFDPSDETCKFCRAKAKCRARADKNLELFDESPDPALITLDEAGQILEKAKDIKAWLKDLEDLVFESLKAGAAVPGWKLVAGRSNRQLPPEDKVVELMTKAGYDESLLYDRHLLTLTDLERSFGKKAVGEILGDFITKPEGKPTLAPESDPRKPWSSTEEILKAFDEV